MTIDREAGTIAASARWGFRDTAILLSLVVLGGLYFGRYYDCGFNVTDEGSIVLLSARLLDGERPFTDVLLGYGLLWYYPLVALFQFTGVSFIAARLYFLSLALGTSLLAFATLRRHGCHRLWAAFVAVTVIAVPGALHKTYLPLIVVANMFCLSMLEPGRRQPRQQLRGRKVFLAALVAVMSYHIRPDLGLIVTFTLLGTLLLIALPQAPNRKARFIELGRLSVLSGAAALVPTLPLLWVAHRQDFLARYLGVLWRPIRHLEEMWNAVAPELLRFAGKALETQVAWAAPAAADSQAQEKAGETLARIPWDAIWREGPQRSLAVLTYLPLFFLALMVIFTVWRGVQRKLESRPIVAADTVGLLSLTGIAYAAFPQFFLFRPDVAHLAQFMPGYLVLSGIVLGRWSWPWLKSSERADRSKIGERWRFGSRLAISAGLVLHLGFYVDFAFPHRASGSIAVAQGRTEPFLAAGGVDVRLRPAERRYLNRITRAIEAHSDEGDTLLCFPYCPGFNVMTGRPTSTRRLYFDDGLLRLEPDWPAQMIRRIKIEQVPLVVVRDWAPNRTEISRFKNWAADVISYLEICYERVESFRDTDVYWRGSAAVSEPPGAPESTVESSVCFDRPTVRTEAYLSALNITALEHRGSDFSNPDFDFRHVASKLGRSPKQMMSGVDYDFERLAAAARRLEDVDRGRVLREIFARVTHGANSYQEKHLRLADFLAKALHNGRLFPTYPKGSPPSLLQKGITRVEDPLLLLELGDARSDQVALVAVDLWLTTGLSARQVLLGGHTVAELFYDGAWHYLDAAAFRGAELVRQPDGTLPSVAELSQSPLAVDRPASYLEPSNGGELPRNSPPYPSFAYFAACSDCGGRKNYRFKVASLRQPDLLAPWHDVLLRGAAAEDIALSELDEKSQPGAPRFLKVEIGDAIENQVAVELHWQRSYDRDDDLLGYRVYISEQSRGWSYEPTGAAAGVLPYWSHPDGWHPSMYDRLFELPGSEVLQQSTVTPEIQLTLDAGRTYFVTVMPFDAHGEAIGREIYRASQELKLEL